jgi:hypothetical protein
MPDDFTLDAIDQALGFRHDSSGRVLDSLRIHLDRACLAFCVLAAVARAPGRFARETVRDAGAFVGGPLTIGACAEIHVWILPTIVGIHRIHRGRRALLRADGNFDSLVTRDHADPKIDRR